MNAGDFTFLHAADLHLGSPFRGLSLKDEEVARRIAQCSRDAFRLLVDRTIEAKAAFAVIAGDIYDGEWNDVAIGHFFIREVARLHRAGIPVFTLRGNHDAVSEVTRSLPLPPSVREFPTDRAGTLTIEPLRVALHGHGYALRDVTDNLALAYPPPVAGYINIGVLHTALTGRPGHASYAPCKVEDLVSRGYDYWALGHVHEYEEVHRNPWIVYPGNLQGRSVRECGPKGAVLVDVRSGRIAGLRRLTVGRARWGIAQVVLDGIDEEQAALDAMREAIRALVETGGEQFWSLRVRLTGACALHRRLASAHARIAEEVQAIASHLGADIWIEKLEIATEEPVCDQPARSALAGLDIEAALAEAMAELESGPEPARILGQIASKFPGGVAADTLDDPRALLAEARALVLGRIAALGP